MSGCAFASVTGNLTRDPELMHTSNGNTLCKFSIAVNGYKKGDVSFIDIVAWNRSEKYKLAELCSQYLSKGKQVQVVGDLKEDRWEDKETGKKRSRLQVVADKVVFLGSQNEGRSKDTNEDHSPEITDDEIPF